MTSKRTKSNDWKLKSADCGEKDQPPLPFHLLHACLGFELTISEKFREDVELLGSVWTKAFLI